MPPAANRYRFGVYEADLRSGELRKNGVRLKLQEQPFQVLAMLLERPGVVVTREELRQRLWPADTFVDFDHSLNTAINKLRDALGDSASNPRFIETLARRGYRLIAPACPVSPSELASPPLGVPPLSLPGLQRPGGATTVAQSESPRGAEEAELPKIERRTGRSLFALLQIMYLCFYLVSLAKLHAVGRIAEREIPSWDRVLVVIVVVAAVLGIPTRLYLLAAVTLDFRKLGKNFRRLFPSLFVLDELWALAPFLLVDRIGFGLAFAATAALLYVPFSQRTLIRMTYTDCSRQVAVPAP
jgi:cholera toxin transcriptional activator